MEPNADRIDIEKMEMRYHLDDHNDNPDYYCKYCIKNRLEALDLELPKSNDGETIKKP